jgi:hypothetical protein
MNNGISHLVSIGKEIRRYYARKLRQEGVDSESRKYIHALFKFQKALRKFLASQPVPADGRFQFWDDDILIRIEPCVCEDTDPE